MAAKNISSEIDGRLEGGALQRKVDQVMRVPLCDYGGPKSKFNVLRLCCLSCFLEMHQTTGPASSIFRDRERAVSTMRHRCISVGLGVMVWGLLSLGVSSTPATADLVTFQFAGQLTSVESTLEAATGIRAGQSFVGTYTFDTTTPRTLYDFYAATTYEERPITNATASIGGNVVLSPSMPTTSQFLFLQPPYGTRGSVTYIASMEYLDTHVSINDFRLRGANVSLRYYTAVSFNDLSLSAVPPSLSSFTHKIAQFRFQDGSEGKFHFAEGRISSLTAVPIPAALLLFGTGLTTLIGLGAVSWRQQQT